MRLPPRPSWIRTKTLHYLSAVWVSCPIIKQDANIGRFIISFELLFASLLSYFQTPVAHYYLFLNYIWFAVRVCVSCKARISIASYLPFICCLCLTFFVFRDAFYKETQILHFSDCCKHLLSYYARCDINIALFIISYCCARLMKINSEVLFCNSPHWFLEYLHSPPSSQRSLRHSIIFQCPFLHGISVPRLHRLPADYP